MTASIAETELMTMSFGLQASALAVASARTVGVWIVSRTQVSAPDAFCRAICDA
jgi:hypothetical protein